MEDPTHDRIARAQAGDEEAIQHLLREHLTGLRAFVRLRMGHELRTKESSADIVQDVLLDLLQGMKGLEYRSAGEFRHWLFTRAEHRIVDRVRYYHRARRDIRKEVRGPDGSTRDDQLLACYRTFLSPSRHASAREELERAEEAFGKLPDDYRDVILLRRVIGLSYDEVAERMGRSRQAVYNLYSRALARLSTLLDEGC